MNIYPEGEQLPTLRVAAHRLGNHPRGKVKMGTGVGRSTMSEEHDANETPEVENNTTLNRRRFVKALGTAGTAAVGLSGISAGKSNRVSHHDYEGEERDELIEKAYTQLSHSGISNTLVEAGYGVAQASGVARKITTKSGEENVAVLLPLTISMNTEDLKSDKKPISNVNGDIGDLGYYVWRKDKMDYAIRTGEIEKLAPDVHIEPTSDFSMSDEGVELITQDRHIISISYLTPDHNHKEVIIYISNNDISVQVEMENGGSVGTLGFCNTDIGALIRHVGTCAAGCAGCGSLATGNISWIAVAGCIVCGGCGCGFACCIGKAANWRQCIVIQTAALTSNNIALMCMASGCDGGC